MTASIKGPLIERLRSFDQVAAIAGGRVYPNRIPQGLANFPCVVVKLDTRERNQHLGQFDDSLVFDELEIVAYARDSADAELIGCDIAESIEEIEGESISDGSNSITRTVAATMIIDEEDDCIALGEQGDELIQYYQIELQIQHSPSN